MSSRATIGFARALVTVLLGLAGSPVWGQNADLSVSLSGLPNPVNAGAVLTYTLTVSNEGPDDAATVVLDDALPTGTTFSGLTSPVGWSCTQPSIGSTGSISCSLATLTPGSAVFTLQVTVDGTLADGTVLSDTATVSTTTADSSSNDHQATENTVVSAPAAGEIALVKTATPNPVSIDSDLTYTLAATNASGTEIKSATITDPLPAGTVLVSLSAPAGWSCVTPAAGAGGTVTCAAAPFPPGDATFVLVVHVTSTLAGSSSLSNTATLDVSSNGRPASTSATTAVALEAPIAAIPTLSGQGLALVGGLLLLAGWRLLRERAR